MVFFCSKKQILTWSECPPVQIFIDGYHKVPKQFSQLISIMGFFPKYGKALPILHCLTDSKTAENYKTLFIEAEGIFKKVLDNRNLVLSADVVTTDFELGLIKAAEFFWPKAEIMGCFVHFLRCQTTNLKKCGLMDKSNRKTSYQLLTLMSTLPFVEEDTLEDLYKGIKEVEMFAEKYGSYFEYFEKTWLYGTYPISVWSVSQKKGTLEEKYKQLQHSNNSIESFHSVLKFVLNKSDQPTLTEFIEGLKFIEGNMMTNLNNYQEQCIFDVRVI